MKKRKHVCESDNTCRCQSWMLEPAFGCPVHDGGDWPPRCKHCGRFMKWERFLSLDEKFVAEEESR
jgi:hypothetical protein